MSGYRPRPESGEPQAAVEPPSLDEVMAIVRRRRDSRRRLAAASLSALAVAGIGWAGVTLGSRTAPEPATPPSTTPAPRPEDREPQPSESAEATEARRDVTAELSARFRDAGYADADAAALAAAWLIEDQAVAEIVAGAALQRGAVLPGPGEAGSGEALPTLEAMVTDYLNAYTEAGYTLADADALAAEWQLARPYDAKFKAAAFELADLDVPVEPSGPELAGAWPDELQPVTAAFGDSLDVPATASGGALETSEQLAAEWRLDSSITAKAVAGALVLGGRELPVDRDGAAPYDATAADLAAYFAAAGYGDDARASLAEQWGLTPLDASVVAAVWLLVYDDTPLPLPAGIGPDPAAGGSGAAEPEWAGEISPLD